MKVIIACESSGRVRDAMRSLGHDAVSCDLLPSEQPGPHIQDDIRNVNLRRFDMMIGHPPCTYLCNSGVCWLYNKDGTKNEQRWENMRQAAEFFVWMLSQDVPRIAIENPIMHKHAREIVKWRQSQVIQPWQFGHGETKATCLWLRGLPLLRPTNVVPGREQRVHRLSPGPDRWKERSRTFEGIASAMACQWAGRIESEAA